MKLGLPVVENVTPDIILTEDQFMVTLLEQTEASFDQLQRSMTQYDTNEQLDELITIVSEEGFNDTLEKLYGAELRKAGIDTTLEKDEIVALLESSKEEMTDQDWKDFWKEIFEDGINNCKLIIKQLESGAELSFPTKATKRYPADVIKENITVGLELFFKVTDIVFDNEDQKVEDYIAEIQTEVKKYMKRGFWGPKLAAKRKKMTFEEAGWDKATLLELCKSYVNVVTDFDKLDKLADRAPSTAAQKTDKGFWGKIRIISRTNKTVQAALGMVMHSYDEMLMVGWAAKLIKK